MRCDVVVLRGTHGDHFAFVPKHSAGLAWASLDTSCVGVVTLLLERFVELGCECDDPLMFSYRGGWVWVIGEKK